MNTAAAPRPNSTTIGGSGTFVPEVLPVVPELELVDELVELEVDELVEVEVDELVELLVELDVLEVMLPEVELVLVTLPELVEVELPPVEVEVELPPVDVEVELPVLELSMSISMSMPLVDCCTPEVVVVVVVVVLPDEPVLPLVPWFGVGVPPLDVVVVTLKLPLPPPVNPPKKPPNPPKPLEPPMMTGAGLPVATTAACGSGGMGIGIICGAQQFGASTTRSIGAGVGDGVGMRGEGCDFTCLIGRSTTLPDL